MQKLTLNNNSNEDGFNLKQAGMLVTSYSRSTGTSCRIIDTKGNSLFETGSCSCNLCNKDNNTLRKKSSCSDAHLYGGYQAERFGGCYIFFCPIGLTYWASPVSPDDCVAGYLIGGPIMMVEPEEFMLDESLNKYEIDDIKREELTAFIERIPVISPEAVNDIADLLFAVASQLSIGVNAKSEEHAQRKMIQAQIFDTVHEIKNAGLDVGHASNYPYEKEKKLLTSVSLGDKPASQKLLNEILGYIFFSSGSDLKIIKLRIWELIVLLSRAAIEGGADIEEIFGLNQDYFYDIDKYQNLDDLTYWLSKVLARFTDCVFNLADVRHKDAIFKSIDYIKKHYMNKLTLDEVANYVYLNPSYLSKIFKNELGYTFVSYVNKLRVEVSKQLLFDPTVPLTDVSSLVGFDEQSYFTKVFKKQTDMTPGSFRKSMGKQTDPLIELRGVI